MAGTKVTSTGEWSDSITLAAAERWQVRRGEVLLTFGASTPASITSDEGLHLIESQIISLPSGAVVRHRSFAPGNAIIAREAVA